MPMNPADYPPDWRKISRDVRERAGWRCECTGQCGADHALERDADGLLPGAAILGRCAAVHDKRHPITGSRVIMTVAHLWRGPCADHHAAGVKCGDPAHLLAMCQRCHLAYDSALHAANARERRRRRRATGDLFDPR